MDAKTNAEDATVPMAIARVRVGDAPRFEDASAHLRAVPERVTLSTPPAVTRMGLCMGGGVAMVGDNRIGMDCLPGPRFMERIKWAFL